MTLALKMADIEYDAYEEGFDKGREDGLQVGLQQGLQQGIEQGLEQGLQRGIEQGLEQGAHQNKLETARNLLAEGVASQIVARCTGLPMETIHQLIQED